MMETGVMNSEARCRKVGKSWLPALHCMAMSEVDRALVDLELGSGVGLPQRCEANVKIMTNKEYLTQ